MNWIVKWKVKGKVFQSEVLNDYRVAVLLANTMPFDDVEVFPEDESIAHVTPLKDGRVILEVHERCEMLDDGKGKATTFMYLTMDQLEKVYKELGHYLFDLNLKGGVV